MATKRLTMIKTVRELMNDIAIFSRHPVEAFLFLCALVLWCRIVFRVTRRFVHGEPEE